MKDNYIDVNTMTNIIKEIPPEKQQLYINLYKNYNLLYKNYNIKNQKVDFIGSIDSEAKREINELEDKIYTVKGRVLTQRERVILELNNILKYMSKNGKNVPQEIAIIVLNETKELKRVYDRYDLDTNEIINYFKKRISILQAYLGLKIKFFNAALEVFDEQILIIKIGKSPNLNKARR